MSLFAEFKKFAMRGNVIDMAIGVIIGTAFGKIVSSLVDDVIMPPIGYMLGGVDFSKLAIKIKRATPTSSEVLIKYGSFINTVINFLIIAFIIFMALRVINKLFPKPKVEPTQKDCPECLMSIPIKAKKCGHCQTLLQ